MYATTQQARVIAADLPDARGFYSGIVDDLAPQFTTEAEGANTSELVNLVDRFRSRPDINAADHVRLIVAYEELARRSA